MIAALLHLNEGARPAGEFGHQMRCRLACGHDVGHSTRCVRRPACRPQLLRVAQHEVDAGQRRPAAGSICAAQPVTTMRAPGRSRAARRIACRAWRTASAVTAQVLTITVSDSRGGVAAHDLAFVGVEATAEGEDLDAHGG